MLRKLYLFNLILKITSVLLIWQCMALSLMEKYLLWCYEYHILTKLDWGSYIVVIVWVTFERVGALIHSTKFLSPNVALYLCNLAWNTAVRLVLLVATWICQLSYRNNLYKGKWKALYLHVTCFACTIINSETSVKLYS